MSANGHGNTQFCSWVTGMGNLIEEEVLRKISVRTNVALLSRQRKIGNISPDRNSKTCSSISGTPN